MSIELTRRAHYSGEGLEVPVEVWGGQLDEKNEVFFTQGYDSEQKQAQTVSLVIERDLVDGALADRYIFQTAEKESASEQYLTMLAHAALYFADDEGQIHAREGAADIEDFMETGALLRHHQINRARYLPEVS